MDKKEKRIIVMGGNFNPPTLTVEQWQGENLLGCALMEVRDWLKTVES